jgi:hypothetical protein
MTFKDSFCPSPWFHMRVTNSGDYDYCRWQTKHSGQKTENIRDTTPKDFFQNSMASIRMQMLAGETPLGCADCYLMDKHNKVSGRQKQLLKTGVRLEYFDKSMLTSAWSSEYKNSYDQQGIVDLLPQDWQIDLGNFCNSACLFCHSNYSSSLAVEWKKLGLLQTMPARNWCDDDKTLQVFLDTLLCSKKLSYLHFIGGETLITPAFKKILKELIKAGLASDVTIGFTTSLITWDESIIDLLGNFKQVNLGMSVECLHPVNDYVRYPSKIDQVQDTINRWIDIANSRGWLLQIRTTPTILTISHLLTIFEFAYSKNISVESCNFLDHPAYMRPTVLPLDYRVKIIESLDNWLKDKTQSVDTVVNTRDPNKAKLQVVQDAQSYVNYLKNQGDESHMLPELINYLKIMESNRKNTVLDYLPEYEQLFRAAGY